MPYVGDLEKYVIKAILNLGNKVSGVAIKEELQRVLGRSFSNPAIYTTLDRLQKKDFVTTAKDTLKGTRGERTNRRFRVTSRGKRALRESMEDLRKLGLL